jgi:xanthine dehydrogenase YagS FAD-binding subunit
MQPFEYASPKTLKEALGLLGTDTAILAGGTDLLALMKDGVVTPKRVVNIKGIAELAGISKTDAGLRIGPTATVDDLLTNPEVRALAPALADAARGIAGAQMRNMGTVGGDLCQRPRCWYFRAGFGILARNDGKALVPDGDNRYHAIFPMGEALFVSASSFGPALVAYGARIKIASPKGTREVDAAKFFVAPASNDAREIALQPNEIVTDILVPVVEGMKSATYEVRQKDALDWPLATASVALKMKGTAVASAKIVLGHVAATPYDSAAAAKAVAGRAITAATAEAAGKAAVEAAQPLKDNAYKVQLASTAVKRALLAAVAAKG